MELNTIVAIISIIGFLFAVFNYVVIRPLTNAIQSLKEVIEEIKTDLKEEIKNHNKLNVRLSVLEDKVNNLESR